MARIFAPSKTHAGKSGMTVLGRILKISSMDLIIISVPENDKLILKAERFLFPLPFKNDLGANKYPC